MKFKKIIGKLIWNVSERFNIPLGKNDKYAPIVLGWCLGCTNYKKVK